jgi:hypothetical protein
VLDDVQEVVLCADVICCNTSNVTVAATLHLEYFYNVSTVIATEETLFKWIQISNLNSFGFSY